MPDLPYDWITFIFILAALIYTLFTIKNEKLFIRQHGYILQWGPFKFSCPPWWIIRENKLEKLLIVSKDSKLDWSLLGTRIAGFANSRECLQYLLQQDQIRFDTPNSPFELANQKIPHCRMEGMATIMSEDRRYIDIICLQFQQYYYVFKSESGVLQGLVEGPQFEEMLKSLKQYD